MSNLNHVAIIMDGNGRWAKNRFRPRVWGHVRGASVVSEIVQAADDAGVKALTLYAFSTENWSRPLEEVSLLFKLLKKFLLKEKNKILQNNISFKVIGELNGLPIETIELIEELEKRSASHTGLKLTFAFNYGAKSEIVRAMNTHIVNNPGMHIKEEDLDKLMYRPEVGNVDLLVRTGGEQRLSNFLLWQIAYSELYFTPTKWPDFTKQEFLKILDHVSKRERRFGNISSKNSLELTENVGEDFSLNLKFKS